MHAAGGPVVLAGYCMGGLLTLAAALRRPDLVRGLALLATPWDFHADGRALAPAPGRHPAAVRACLLAATGTLPVDALQTLFALPATPASHRRKVSRLRPYGPGGGRRAGLRGAGGLAERRRAPGRRPWPVKRWAAGTAATLPGRGNVARGRRPGGPG